MSESKIKILMVCLGNICRSPTAEQVFRQEIIKRGLDQYFHVDSAGTSSWHKDEPPDSRAARAASKRGLDLAVLKGRQVTPEDIEQFDYVFAMDEANYNHLKAIAPAGSEGKIWLLLTFPEQGMHHHRGHSGYREVPDPYYSGEEGFELVLDLAESASRQILDHLIERHQIEKSRD